MATKDDVLAWGEGVKLYKDGKFQESATIMMPITGAIGAKIHFNIGMCYQALKRYTEAVRTMHSPPPP